jgi:methyl-accepting chemotaxis protein-2 (aspartate sensor receptor)
LFVAFDLTEFDRSLEQMVAGARFFDSGGIYVLDPRGGDAKQATLMLPPALRGRTLADVAGAGPELLAALRCQPRGHRAAAACAPCFGPTASDRFAVARPSAGTGWIGRRRSLGRRGDAAAVATLAPFLALFGWRRSALCGGQYLLIRPLGRPAAEACSPRRSSRWPTATCRRRCRAGATTRSAA